MTDVSVRNLDYLQIGVSRTDWRDYATSVLGVDAIDAGEAPASRGSGTWC